jgi:hypothetical protein
VAIERADGTLEGYASVLSLNAARYRERFGSATPALHRRLETAAPDERIAVALRFALPALGDILRTPKPLRALENERSVATATEPVAAWLAEHGFVESYRSRHMPALFGTLPAKALGVVVNDPRLTRAALNDRIQIAGNGEFATLDPVAEHSIDTTWNTCGGCGTGNYGAGVPVGMIEWCGYDDDDHTRAIFEVHDAFEHLASSTVFYAEAPQECTNDADCVEESELGCTTGQVRCLLSFGGTQRVCTSIHASEVASVISASKSGTPSGAAKIKLNLANSSKPYTTEGYVKAYDYLADQQVALVNETHEGLTYGDGLQVADYFARVHRILPVQSAGNEEFSGTLEACPKSANSLCVGASTSSTSLGLAPYSVWLNPAGTTADREEPDVVAFGGVDGGDQVKVLSIGGASDWSGAQQGTSFSAPIVTNMLAHFVRECIHQDPVVLRAITRTAAWAGNPVGWNYSTPSDIFDHYDGGGWVDAPALDWFCNFSSGSDGGAGVVTVDLTGGSDPAGTGTEYEPGEPPPSGATNYTPPHDNSTFARKEYLLAEGVLAVGDRVRFTISWDACATDEEASTTAPVDIDLDLFLLAGNSGNYIYGSQSVDDNNEGFDVRISEEDGAGRYRVVYSRPAAVDESCGSSTLALGWAGRWGSPW